MKRLNALKKLYPQLADKLVVTNMGGVAVELNSLGHQPNFFYLQHAMGLASSIGLGLALSLPRQRIVVFDGDGSVLMNLGTFATLARYRPDNLTHVIFDNQSLLSVGGFPTATATGSDLAGIAQAAGIQHTTTVKTLKQLEQTFAEALDRTALSVIVAKVEDVGPSSFAMDVNLLENRFQFRRHIANLSDATAATKRKP